MEHFSESLRYRYILIVHLRAGRFLARPFRKRTCEAHHIESAEVVHIKIAMRGVLRYNVDECRPVGFIYYALVNKYPIDSKPFALGADLFRYSRQCLVQSFISYHFAFLLLVPLYYHPALITVGTEIVVHDFSHHANDVGIFCTNQRNIGRAGHEIAGIPVTIVGTDADSAFMLDQHNIVSACGGLQFDKQFVAIMDLEICHVLIFHTHKDVETVRKRAGKGNVFIPFLQFLCHHHSALLHIISVSTQEREVSIAFLLTTALHDAIIAVCLRLCCAP